MKMNMESILIMYPDFKWLWIILSIDGRVVFCFF